MYNIDAAMSGLTKLDFETALQMDYRGCLVTKDVFKFKCTGVLNLKYDNGEGGSLKLIGDIPLPTNSVRFISEDSWAAHRQMHAISYGNDSRLPFHPMALTIDVYNNFSNDEDGVIDSISVTILSMCGMDESEVFDYTQLLKYFLNKHLVVVEQ
jgi:hypothetical protein